MKKTLMILAAAMMSIMAMAQTEYMPIRVYVEDVQEPFPHNAKIQVENKLTQLLTANGLASMDPNSQFVLTVFAIPQNKEVLATAPVQYVETMEMTFYVADVANNTVFSSTSQTVRGIGNSDTKAYMDAVRKINIKSQEMARFIEQGKEKIIAYYNHEAARILTAVRAQIKMKEFDQAIFTAMSIPAQCQAYDEAQQLMIEAYQAYIDQECMENLAQAKAAWASQQNADGAADAGRYLSAIYPDSKCYGDAEALYAEIKGKVLDDWKFEMKKYNDQTSLESQRIQSATEIGVAYGNHQQPVSTNIGFLRN